jgi:hypothetical protein
MYKPMHGRFTAPDPLMASGRPANPQTWNRYIYVGNNPLYWVDPTGLIWGKNDDGQVRWFDKKLGNGFTEFTPDAWQYEGTNGRIIQLDANSSNWNYVDPVEVVAESNPIQELAQAVTDGVTDGFTGIAKGVGNSPSVALNGVTGCIFNCGVQGAYFQGSNPFEVPLIFPYSNEREASYGSASSTGTLLGLGVAGGTIFGGSSVTSVVPEVAPTTPTVAVHGNSLNSLRPTWGYKLFQNDGTFLKNGITSQRVAEARYTKAFMEDKFMVKELFPNRRAARMWEFERNTVSPGPLNIRR